MVARGCTSTRIRSVANQTESQLSTVRIPDFLLVPLPQIKWSEICEKMQVSLGHFRSPTPVPHDSVDMIMCSRSWVSLKSLLEKSSLITRPFYNHTTKPIFTSTKVMSGTTTPMLRLTASPMYPSLSPFSAAMYPSLLPCCVPSLLLSPLLGVVVV